MQITKRVLVLGLVLVMSCSLCACSVSDYKKADEFLSSGDYNAALAIFEVLSEKSYKDSSEKVLECKYLKAAELFESMDYSGAEHLYSEIAEYKDADELRKQSTYYLANLYATNENYALAYTTFCHLGNYKDSAYLASMCSKFMLSSAAVGDAIFYGFYEQDGNFENGPEPIQWLVLGRDGDNMLLLSEYVLENMPFDSYSYFWKNCSLREWLNNSFYNSAFTLEERDSIQKMITSEDTEDFVFCLSAEEARGLFPSDESRIAYPTDALLNNGYRTWSTEGTTDWWTRSISTAKNGKGVVIVEGDGNVRSAGAAPNSQNQYSYSDTGPRPAICISISETVLEPQNMSMFGFNSNTDLDHEPNLWIGSGASGGKCIICNGTGYVRYYYGSSDLEAWLTGHDAYTVGTCPSCDGTGKDK